METIAVDDDCDDADDDVDSGDDDGNSKRSLCCIYIGGCIAVGLALLIDVQCATAVRCNNVLIIRSAYVCCVLSGDVLE